MAKQPTSSPAGSLKSPLLPPNDPSLSFPTSSKSAVKAAADGSSPKRDVTKFKQSKSRNGCVTCKAKRLKCDESKPTCQQCHKRGVECGGYKKDFKWRPFEEASFSTKPAPSKSKKSTTSKSKATDQKASGTSAQLPGDATLQDMINPNPLLSPQFPTSSMTAAMPGSGFSNGNPYAPLPIYTPDPSLFPFDPSQVAYSPSTYLDEGRFAPNTSQDNSTPDGASGFPSPTATTRLSGRSPRLIDLLLPGSDLNARPGSLPGYQEPQSISAYRPLSEPSNEVYQNGPGEDDEIEEVIREPDSMPQGWVTCLPSPAPSHVSLVSNDSQGGVIKSMYRQVDFPASSPEMLMLRFDQQTCGILSIKDGPTENPWRTMMWPMAVDAPALYHAVAAMTAFHTSRERPSLRMAGVEHMRQSIHLLATGIESMRTDTALATTLALAFSESWDQHILSGIRHLRGARILVNQALVKHNKFSSSRHEFARLRFLINAWVYMDVLSQLTSLDDADTINFDHVMPFLYGPFGANTELDPLMGSAGTLFPLIGKAANLVRRVRKSKSNSPAIISQALDLKLQIETWNSGRSFETPEDPSSEIEHSVHTAEAYRWATLLYLHQAVPEMPSMTTAQLAKRVLVYLARVPLSSRAVVVHIYPLLAAGSEAVSPEDRSWVKERWAAMVSRMWIGNIERCWEVIAEVWDRRDRFDAQQAEYSMVSSDDLSVSGARKRKFEMMDDSAEGEMYSEKRLGLTLGDTERSTVASYSLGEMKERIPFERTVRGSIHWAGVMREWGWEVLLG